jgi:hypothetical protein
MIRSREYWNKVRELARYDLKQVEWILPVWVLWLLTFIGTVLWFNNSNSVKYAFLTVFPLFFLYLREKEVESFVRGYFNREDVQDGDEKKLDELLGYCKRGKV